MTLATSHRPSSNIGGVILSIAHYECADCGGSDAYRSRRRTVLEKFVLPLFLLKPVRCVNCFRRSSVSLFVHARPRERRAEVKHHVAA
jgi:hypothetical protein